MKKNQTISILLVVSIFILISFAVACSGFSSSGSNKTGNNSATGTVTSTSVPSVSETGLPVSKVTEPVTVAANTSASSAGLDKLEVWFQLDSENKPAKVVVTGEITQARAWVGRSLYIPGCKDAVKEGDHTVVEVSRGKFIKTWDIDEKFYNGTYEVALWGKTVDKANCKVPGCASCKIRGYHVENMLLYKSGYILSK